MSKNSPIQNYECAKAFAQVMETARKKQQSRQPKQSPQQFKKHHPALKYNGE